MTQGSVPSSTDSSTQGAASRSRARRAVGLGIIAMAAALCTLPCQFIAFLSLFQTNFQPFVTCLKPAEPPLTQSGQSPEHHPPAVWFCFVFDNASDLLVEVHPSLHHFRPFPWHSSLVMLLDGVLVKAFGAPTPLAKRLEESLNPTELYLLISPPSFQGL